MHKREQRLTRLARSRLYCCTDAHGSLTDFQAFVEALFSAGVDIIQFRDKTMEARTAWPYILALVEQPNGMTP